MGPQDVLEVTVFKAPDLLGPVCVAQPDQIPRGTARPSGGGSAHLAGCVAFRERAAGGASLRRAYRLSVAVRWSGHERQDLGRSSGWPRSGAGRPSHRQFRGLSNGRRCKFGRLPGRSGASGTPASRRSLARSLRSEPARGRGAVAGVAIEQVEHNRESTKRQYALASRATELGWSSQQVTVIDEDLGLSGSGAVERSGFARLAVGLGARPGSLPPRAQQPARHTKSAGVLHFASTLTLGGWVRIKRPRRMLEQLLLPGVDLIGVDFVAAAPIRIPSPVSAEPSRRPSPSALHRFCVCYFSSWFAPSSTTERPILQLSHWSQNRGTLPFGSMSI
jgi:hypothetical protein